MKLYLFNPENDIALVHGRRHFTMSPVVARLHDDGALLPLWYADGGDLVLGSCSDPGWLHDVRMKFGLDAVPVMRCDSSVVGSPWGWSFDAARRLSAAGASVIDDVRIGSIAALSHRRISVEVMRRLHSMLPFALPPVPEELTSCDRLSALVSQSAVYVKAPWSSSGRGVFRVDAVDDMVAARVNGILRRQGSVLVESALDKRLDFAMLFRACGGKVEWAGYSLFFNSMGDAYGGNILADDASLEDMLVSAGASRDRLHAIRDALVVVLAELIGDAYDGYFGVDMLLTASGMIDPCVEVNLRMTMGVVAHILASRYVADGRVGLFRVTHGLSGADALPVVENSRLVDGKVYLTPRSVDGFNFTMEICDHSTVSNCL